MIFLKMLIGDWTSNRWVTAFSDVGEVLLGKSSQEIGEMLEHDKDAADKIFSEVIFEEKIFKLRTKVETFQVRQFEVKNYFKHLNYLFLFPGHA